MSTNFSKFILIENPGVAPVEAFTLLGASNKSGSDAIGQFGSGTKLGTLSLLREGLDPTIYCGKQRIQFCTKPITFEGARHEKVFVRLSGQTPAGGSINRMEDLSVVLNYGSLDWEDPRLAVREYISNALDAVNGDASLVKVSVVDADSLRAKAGYTRVYVPYTPATAEIVDNLNDWFLHFQKGKVWRQSSIIEKNSPSKARIYRRGVFVREVAHDEPSLFDYNSNELKLDEARTADDWSVKYYAGLIVRNFATPEQLARILLERETVWEHDFDLVGAYESLKDDVKAKRQATWDKVQETLLSDNVVILDREADDSLAVGKGYKILRASEEVVKAARHFGLRTKEKILSADEREGRQVDEVTKPEAIRVCQDVWGIIKLIGADRGEKFPTIKTFTQPLTGGSITKGLYRDGTVLINNCLLAGDAISDELFATVIEEFAHHITKATDNSRDFQEFFIQICVRFLNKR